MIGISSEFKGLMEYMVHSARDKLARMIMPDPPKKQTTDFPFFWGAPTEFKGVDYPIPKLTHQRLRTLSKSPVPRRAINAIKKQVASLDWRIVPKRGIRDKKRHEKDIKFLTDSLNFPNESDSFRTLLEKTIEDILVLDAGSIERKIVSGRPWLWGVDGHTIQMYMDWKGERNKPRYAQWTGSKFVPLLNDELIYIMSNPSNATPFGLSALEVAANTVEYFLGAQQYAGNTVNKATPKKMLDLGRSVDNNHVSAFRMYWANEVAGRGITPIIGGTDRIGVVQIGAADDQGLYLQWQEFLIRVIAMAFDLPPKKLGLSRDINRSTAESDDETTDEEAVKPLAKLIADHINREIIWALGYMDLEFRFSFVVSAKELEAHSRAIRNQAEVDLVSLDEARDELGYPPMEDESLGGLTLTAYRRELGGVDPQPGDPGRSTLNTPLPKEAKSGKGGNKGKSGTGNKGEGGGADV